MLIVRTACGSGRVSTSNPPATAGGSDSASILVGVNTVLPHYPIRANRFGRLRPLTGRKL